MNLVIVESPAKAKTIEGYLGDDFVVKSSFGHVRDLPSKGMNIDLENGFLPKYEVLKDKSKVIKELKDLSKEAELVWLATDEDREGEAISWHLAEVLALKEDKTKRIVFHEITKPAILKAIDSPRTIDKNLVDAQQARRVLDRIVGFEISPVLWRKVKPSLSAGRVQSVAVRLIVEREKEILAFVPVSSFKIRAQVSNSEGKQFEALGAKESTDEVQATEFMERISSGNLTVSAVEKKPAKRNPAPPFTTSTLQQEASRKLGFSVAQTMSVAQRLYEGGKITYMRTDSVNLSDLAIGAAKDEINSSYGSEYSKPRNFATKAKGAQEAHEAIRPTYFGNHTVDGTPQEQRLYELIWKRAIASQMSEAQLEKTNIDIDVEGSEIGLNAKGEVITFDGFLKVYMEGKDEEDSDEQKGLLPKVEVGEKLDLNGLSGKQKFSHHPPRYTEASLVKKLEQLGIGRPSTYAPTISTILKRGYVVKEDRDGHEIDVRYLELKDGAIEAIDLKERTGYEKKKLFPTDIGTVVNDFLTENFDQVLDYNFTAEVEKEFDLIADGEKEWNAMISSFYKPFHENVENILEHSEKATGARLLGTDPESGKNVYARIGRYGSMIQIGEATDEEKPKFASLKGDKNIGNVTLEEALRLFDLPRNVGNYEDEEVIVSQGRFGPYVRHKGKFYSIGEQDPFKINLEEAIALIDQKRKEEANSIIKTFDEDPDVRVLRGRYGPYIKFGKKNVKIPKDKDPESLTYEECVELSKAVNKRGGKSK